VVPPDPMPNSAVKRRSADGSVGSPHVRVGNCQTTLLPQSHPVPDGFLAFGAVIPAHFMPAYSSEWNENRYRI
ncbi:hypothetical protein, partial [Xenorhabdus hominickii]|uniref:hypothetical protein n=1 Tax=Xenorhabdus hominickii TaxID=351679 RepID=UPI001B8057C1